MMEIESDTSPCECSRGKGKSPLRLFHGWDRDPWSDHARYAPTYLGYDTYNGKLGYILGILSFVCAEVGSVYLVFFSWIAKNPIWAQWMWFVLVSAVSLIFALYVALTFMDWLDVLCHVLIGRTRYLFLDREGRLHVHRFNPVHEYAHVAFCDYGSWENYLFHHPIFKVRSGGVFRRCKVMRHGGSSWKLSVGLFDRRIMIIDKVGSRFAIVRELESGPGLCITERERLKQAIRFVTHFHQLSRVLTTLDQRVEFDQAFDAIGTECIELIRLMEASKQTMGRSKHAQLLRERLERVLQKMPAARVETWTEAAAKAEASSATAAE